MNVTKHPSGRPIHKDRTVGKRYWNLPNDGPLNPRLRDKSGFTQAGGFTANLVRDYEDEDYEDGKG